MLPLKHMMSVLQYWHGVWVHVGLGSGPHTIGEAIRRATRMVGKTWLVVFVFACGSFEGIWDFWHYGFNWNIIVLCFRAFIAKLIPTMTLRMAILGQIFDQRLGACKRSGMA